MLCKSLLYICVPFSTVETAIIALYKCTLQGKRNYNLTYKRKNMRKKADPCYNYSRNNRKLNL